MKTSFIFYFLFFVNFISAQTRSELKFDTNIPDAEDHYVAVPTEKPEQGLGLGFIYYDESAGYTYRIMGSLKEENGKLKYIENPNSKTGINIQRIGNLGFKVAKIPASMIKTFGIPQTPEWLATYKKYSGTPEEKLVNRASTMNGARFPQLALPVLQKLYSTKYRSKNFYFELAFSYNALGDFSNAEKISKEAIDQKMGSDEIYKEYIYALLNQKKIDQADQFLAKKIDSFTEKNSKTEAVNNIIAYSSHAKRTDIAKKWLPLFKKISAGTYYENNTSVLEKLIKENDTPSK